MSGPSEMASLLREAYGQIRALRAQLTEHSAPIAIIGAGCRFPAGVSDLASLARVLRAGTDAVGRVPPDRWDAEAFYDADSDAPGKMHTREAACLEGIDQFDADFFGITPREAEHLDPQQRLLLEVAWSALEDAAIPLDRLRGSRTGVFTGLMYSDYVVRALRERGLDGIGAYLGTGGTFSATAGRLSYVLGLQGPTMAVDTACSSSLVSVHLACQALRQGECDLALAGGVNALLTPEPSINLTKARMISPQGRCRTFDAAADGYVRGEGCGLVVLKTLARALADGDRVLGVIRGSAVNHDGRSSGITAPNRLAQQALIEAALATAGASPADIGYVECHGTATPLGDPIEVAALREVLLPGRDSQRPLAIGSVKTNFGHLEGAAGICGLLKALLVVRGAEVFPHLHLQTLNPRIRLDDAALLRIPTTAGPWFTAGGPRLAGVSSFGFVGTNAHVILEAPPVEGLAATTPTARSPQVLTLSGATPEALDAVVVRQAEWFAANPHADFASVARTLNTGRLHQGHRLAVVAGDGAEALRALRAGSGAQVVRGEVRLNRVPRLAFLFTGQGAQQPGMGLALAATEPVFRAALERCDALLRPYLPRRLLELLATVSSGELSATGLAQPALFSVEYALLELWRDRGVPPDFLLGHSLGEYGAAVAAGIFSLEDALTLVRVRGQLMQALPAGGGMAAVLAGEETVRQILAESAPGLAVAGCNAPAETVISGPLAAVESALATCARRGLTAQRLEVSHAFHSELMRPMLDAFGAALARVTFHPATVPIISNVTGEVDAAGAMSQPEYWLRQIVSPVRFAAGVRALAAAGVDLALELGPRPVLTRLAAKTLPDGGVAWLSSFDGGPDEPGAVARAAAALHVRGVGLDWHAVQAPRGGRRIGLPGYPFQRRRYWLPEPTPGALASERVTAPPAAVRPTRPAFSVMFFAATPEAGETDKYRLVIEAARFADRAGFDSVWVPERHFTEMGGLYPNPAVLQAALARETSRIQLRAGSVVASLHHPMRIAEEWSMVDNLSGGRVGISLASGWNPDDFAFFPERYAERHARLYATLDTVRRLWRGDAIELTNGVGQPATVRLRPVPRQRELPVWLTAAGNPESFRRAGEAGANLLTHLLDQDPAELAAKIRIYREARAAGGHDAAAGRVTVMVHTYIGHDLAATRERVRGPFCAYLKASRQLLAGLAHSRSRVVDVNALSERDLDDLVAFLFERFSATRALIGTPESCAPLVETLVAAGVDEIASLLDFGQPTDDVLGGLPALAQLRKRFVVGDPVAADSVSIPGIQEVAPVAVVPQDDLYEVAWRAQASPTAAAEPPASWVVLAPAEAVPDALVAQLGRLRAAVVAVPEGAVDWMSLLAPALGGSPGAVRVVWLEPVAGQGDAAAGWLERARSLVQALLALAPQARLSTVTRGAVAVVGNAPVLAQAPLWAFLRVLAQEQPALWGGLYDLDPGQPIERGWLALATELGAQTTEDKVAWRGAERYVERLARIPGPVPAGNWAVRADAGYVISGGLGGLGLAMAGWLVERGARHLCLLGRSAPSAAARAQLDELERRGVTVKIAAVDVADEAGLRRELDAWRLDGAPAVRGVVHAAGVWRDLPMGQMSAEDLATVLAPKVAGTLALERCVGADLDFFLSCSSLSAVLPAHGQANYAAGNAFLDAHAQWRRAQGRAGLSINWGPWSGIGFGASDHGRRAHERLESFGLRRIAPAPALAALGALLARGGAQAAVVTVDWALLARVDAPLARTALLTEVAGPLVAPATSAEPLAGMGQRVAAATPAEQPALVCAGVAEIIARVFRRPVAELRRDEPLPNLGLDSLMAVEIKNRIRAEFGLDVPLARFLEGSSADGLAEFTAAAWTEGAADRATGGDAAPATEEFTV